jgi:hypothetical protein
MAPLHGATAPNGAISGGRTTDADALCAGFRTLNFCRRRQPEICTTTEAGLETVSDAAREKQTPMCMVRATFDPYICIATLEVRACG